MKSTLYRVIKIMCINEGINKWSKETKEHTITNSDTLMWKLDHMKDYLINDSGENCLMEF